MGKREPFLPTPRLSRSAPGFREDTKLNSSAGGTLGTLPHSVPSIFLLGFTCPALLPRSLARTLEGVP